MQFIYMYDRKFIKLVSNVLRMKVQATYELFRILIGKNRNIIEIETISTCNPVFLSTRFETRISDNYRLSMTLCVSSQTYKPMSINISLDGFPLSSKSLILSFQENRLSTA